MSARSSICEQCGTAAWQHALTWFDGLIGPMMEGGFAWLTPPALTFWFEQYWQKPFIFFRLLKPTADFLLSEIPIRSACFITEARKRGMEVLNLRGPFGGTNHFWLIYKGKKFAFEGLPSAGFLGTRRSLMVDDKARTKKELSRQDWPVAQSRSFWFFQYYSALRYSRQLGFPLVVKPRHGTYARHITTDIRTLEALKTALKTAFAYGPSVVIERYLAAASVVRITVVDYAWLAAVERITPNVLGDGTHSVSELVVQKNSDPGRGEPDDETKTVYRVILDSVSDQLLTQKGYTRTSIPKKGERVEVQTDPFIRLGADLKDVTDVVHPDTAALCQNVAKHFGVRLVGIDVICEDITQSYKNQRFAILELNSLPCIEIHHYPTEGQSRNVGAALVSLVEKYYH